MRMSDWRSDCCASDLRRGGSHGDWFFAAGRRHSDGGARGRRCCGRGCDDGDGWCPMRMIPLLAFALAAYAVFALIAGSLLTAPIVEATLPSGAVWSFVFGVLVVALGLVDRKSTRLNSSH